MVYRLAAWHGIIIGGEPESSTVSLIHAAQEIVLLELAGGLDQFGAAIADQLQVIRFNSAKVLRLTHPKLILGGFFPVR